MGQMERFHWIAIAVAAVVLLITLIFIGILMTSGNKTAKLYPPLANSCPDYWLSDASGNCIVPTTKNVKNTPNISITSGNTRGYDSEAGTIDFKSAGWTQGTTSAICGQQKWCNTMGVTWDGVDNYNAC